MIDKQTCDTFAYMMAAEKMISMICLIEQTMEFMEEYKIIPDNEVKKYLNPLIHKMNTWLETK